MATLTPEQQKKYFAEQSGSTNPLSPLDWLSKQNSQPTPQRGQGESVENFTQRVDQGTPSPTPITDPQFLQLRPGESIGEYNQRIAQARGLTGTTSGVQETTPSAEPSTPPQPSPKPEPPVVGTSAAERVKERQKEIEAIIGATAPERPDLFNEADKQRLLTAQGQRDAIDTELAQILDSKLAIQEEMRAFAAGQTGLPEAGRVGAISEAERNAQQRFDALNRREMVLEMKLRNRNTVISELMGLQKQEFTDALNDYNSRFDQAMQIYSIIDAEEDEAKQDAKVNLEVLFGTLQSQIVGGQLSFDKISPIDIQKIEELEIQAGLPIGSTLSVLGTLEEGEEKIYSGVDDNGVFQYVTRSASGEIRVQSIPGVGTPKAGTGVEDLANNILKVRSAVRQEPSFKLFNDVLNAYQNVQVGVAQDNAAGDLAIVNGIARMLDPGGVVRPAEFTTVEEAQGWLERTFNLPFKVAAGRIASPEAIARFDRLADELIFEKAVPIKQTLESSYGPISLGLGVDLAEAVPEIKQLNRLIGEASGETLYDIGGIMAAPGEVIRNADGEEARVNEDGTLTIISSKGQTTKDPKTLNLNPNLFGQGLTQ